MGERARSQDTLRKLAMIDEGFVEDQAGFGLGPARTSALDPKTAAVSNPGLLKPLRGAGTSRSGRK